jgi:hypothetical protein
VTKASFQAAGIFLADDSGRTATDY